MKKCIIIHGCPSVEEKGLNNKHWMPWIKKELKQKGIAVETPLMPSPWEPDYERFKSEFEKYTVDEDTILVGHSCGCAFLVHWLGETKRKISKLVLVAPWKIPDGKNKYRDYFYSYPIDESIKERVDEIVLFTSDDEEEDGKKSLKIFHDALGGRIVNLSNHGHFIMEHMGTEEFPELLKEIVE